MNYSSNMIAYASNGYNVFEMLNTSAFDLHYGYHWEETVDWTTYDNLMDYSFTENFDNLIFVGANALVVLRHCSFSRASSLFWYETAGVFKAFQWRSEDFIDEWTDMLTYDIYIIPHVRNFTYASTLSYGNIPAEIRLPEIETVRIYTSNCEVDIDAVLYGVSEFNFDTDGVYHHTKLKSVDICCELPLELVGTDDHIALGWEAMHAILYSNKLKFVNISGCHIGEGNDGLSSDVKRMVSAVTQLNRGSGKPLKKNFNLELVRKIDTDMEQMDVLDISLFKSLATYLTSLKITQVSGGEKYTPWSSLVVKLPQNLLTDGLVVEIDSSFGIPKLQYTEGETTYEMTTVAQSAVAPTIGVSKSLRKWIAGKGESTDETWRMIPTGTSFE